jgi:SAM-dependent methyltransferase
MNDYMIRGYCPLCSEEAYKVLKSYDLANKTKFIDGVQLLECLSCGFIYSDRISVNPNDKSKIDYFGIGAQNIGEWEKTKILQKKAIYGYALNLINFQVNSACDVGCAIGIFLDAVTKKFDIQPQSCLAVDLVPKMLAYCSKVKGYNTFNGDLHTNEQHSGYDLITFMEVLEHVPYPKQDLEKAYSMLSSGGGIVIEVPNVRFQYYKSKMQKLLNLKSLGLIPYSHINHFRIPVLRRLLGNIGFKKIRIFPAPSAIFMPYNQVVTAIKRTYDFIGFCIAKPLGLVISPGYLVIARKPI